MEGNPLKNDTTLEKAPEIMLPIFDSALPIPLPIFPKNEMIPEIAFETTPTTVLTTVITPFLNHSHFVQRSTSAAITAPIATGIISIGALMPAITGAIVLIALDIIPTALITFPIIINTGPIAATKAPKTTIPV